MRERLSLDQGWRFALGNASQPALDFEFRRDRSLVKAGEARGAASPKFDDSKWQRVDLPHDWAIGLPFDPRGDKELVEHGSRAIGPDHPEHSVGWYRRSFALSKADADRRIVIEFDGVFRHSIVWVNGHRCGRHESGYDSFHYDITDIATYGGDNVVVVRVDASCWEGWWYEGAGIYRHVWLLKTDPRHVARDGVVVRSKLNRDHAEVEVRTTLVNESDRSARLSLRTTLLDGSRLAAGPVVARCPLAPWSARDVVQRIRLSDPKPWSCQTPHLYHACTEVLVGGRIVDRVVTTFGVRSLRWDAKRGFFLNGKRLKIKGTCNHQQHAGVGIAVPDALHEWRLRKLKEMGSSAYRCSHYPATPELLDLCDRLGLLVMAENRVVGSTPRFIDSWQRMIARDRNHPSIILWSLGNEEHSVQWAIAGERIGRTMVRIAHRLDPTRKVTAAMHDRGLGVGFANIVDVHGWNYIKVGDIERFHRERPRQPIVGSEESSTVCTRGIYADDKSRGYVSAYDARVPGWGTTAEKWWRFFVERDWLAGAFVWTGFDYYGEPIPYRWPCIASHFGLMDLCGFPKDLYWYYRAWWSNDRVLHLFPHWNWEGREGQTIDVRCFSNCDEVELLVNGRSLGSKRVERNSHVAWQVPYRPGCIEAVGFVGGKPVMKHARLTTGAPTRLQLDCDREKLRADGRDVAVVRVSALDADGREHPTANDLVQFEISGAGRLLGVGNGDPSSHESDKAPLRSLFNGLAMVLVQAGDAPGKVTIAARADGLSPAGLTLAVT